MPFCVKGLFSAFLIPVLLVEWAGHKSKPVDETCLIKVLYTCYSLVIGDCKSVLLV